MKINHLRLVPSALLALGTLASAPSVSAKGAPQEAVKHSIVTMVNAIDSKQWDTAIAQFADQVFVDYSSLSGQPGKTTKAADLVGGWEALLEGVSTHHMLSNFAIAVNGNQAEAFSHVYASHTAEGIDYWDAYGRYQHQLTNDNGQWKITGMKRAY